MAHRPRRLAAARAHALVLILTAGLFWPGAARADDTDAFLKASAGAYAPYRAAVSYLHTGNPGLGALAIDAMAARWTALCDRFRDQAPDAFAEDAAWQSSLDEISERIAAAQAKIAAGDTEAAEATLKPIRGLLGDLRRRNGVITHSDRVDAFSAAMETMWVYRRNPPDMANAQTLATVAEQVRTLRRTMEDVAAKPPEATAADPQFQRLIVESRVSFERLERALDTRDATLLISALRELRSSERLLWMNFG
jgi:hypothetical protein